MSDAQLLHRQDLVVELDYGQFYLYTADVDPELVPEVVDRAIDGEGIAQSKGVLVVESPHQNNFEMPLAVELWDGPPADDLAQWQEAYEAHLDVADAGLTYESPTVDLTEIAVPPGSFHALITGRGFVSRGWPGSTEPGDEWRIRLWPSAGPARPRRLRTFIETEAGTQGAAAEAAEYAADAVEQGRERALAAGRRIKADLDRAATARPLSGDLGAAVIDVQVPGRVARFWFLVANLDVTGMSARGDPVVGASFSMDNASEPDDDDDKDPITGTQGEISCRWIELDDPNRVVVSWEWLGPEGWDFVRGGEMYDRMRTGTLPRDVPRLDQPSTLTVQLRDATSDSETHTTAIHLVHSDVPVEWIPDLVDFWNSTIDMWIYQAAQPDKDWRRHGR